MKVASDIKREGAGGDRRDRRWRVLGLAIGGLFAAVLAIAMLMPVPTVAPRTPGLDKVVHFVAFAALIFPVILTDSRRWFWAVPLAIAYGGAIELIQPLTGRGAEWLDWGADVSGVLAGAALGEMFHDRMRRKFVDEPARADVADEAARAEALRAEMMDDLRVVLREELAVIARPAPDLPHAPTDAEPSRPAPRH